MSNKNTFSNNGIDGGLFLCAVFSVVFMMIFAHMQQKEKNAKKLTTQHTDDSCRSSDTIVRNNIESIHKIYARSHNSDGTQDFNNIDRYLIMADGTQVVRLTNPGIYEMSIFRNAQCGDSLQVNISWTSDKACQFEVVRHVARDKAIKQFSKQK